MKEKGRVFDDLAAAFEKWVLRDVDWGINKRDKSNDLVKIYCPGCNNTKEVKKGKEERTTLCQPCDEQMLDHYSYLNEINARNNTQV